eukprot:6204501-Pleurochrysis_carterae.AAC.2
MPSCLVLRNVHNFPNDTFGRQDEPTGELFQNGVECTQREGGTERKVPDRKRLHQLRAECSLLQVSMCASRRKEGHALCQSRERKGRPSSRKYGRGITSIRAACRTRTVGDETSIQEGVLALKTGACVLFVQLFTSSTAGSGAAACSEQKKR